MTMSQQYISNETLNDVFVVRHQGVPVVRVHDIPLVRLYDVSCNPSNETATKVAVVRLHNVSELRSRDALSLLRPLLRF